MCGEEPRKKILRWRFRSARSHTVRMARTLSLKPITVESLDRIKRMAVEAVRKARRGLKDCRYVDLRLEIIEGKSASAENGGCRQAWDDYVFGFGIRVLAGSPLVSAGH